MVRRSRAYVALFYAAAAATASVLLVRTLAAYRRQQRQQRRSSRGTSSRQHDGGPVSDATGGAFAACAARVAATSARGGVGLSQEHQLALYGLYKQATLGPWTHSGLSAPAAWDVTGLVKWRSWQKVSALTPEEAQLEYIRLAHALLGDNDVGGSSEEQPKTKRPAGFGPVMSTLMGGCGSDVPSVQSSRPQGLEAAHAGVAAAASLASPTQLESARDAVIGAAREGDVRALALALAALPPPAGVNDVRSPGGVTPLMWAADGGHADAVQALLDAGADADAADDEGDTALQYAQGCGHEDIAQLLATRTL